MGLRSWGIDPIHFQFQRQYTMAYARRRSRLVTARLRQCCAGGLTSLPVQWSAVSAQRCCSIHRRPTTLRPHHRHTRQFPLVEGPGAYSVQAGDNRLIVHWTVQLLTTWLQICAVCLICLPDDVWDRHSLISSLSASRSVLLLETELSLWLVLDYGTVCHTTSSRVTSWTKNIFI